MFHHDSLGAQNSGEMQLERTDVTAPPVDVEELQRRITEIQATLPKRMRDCGAYVLSHWDRIAFETVAEVASNADVAPSAMIRFSKLLGFSGFAEMQRLFRAKAGVARPDYKSRLAALKEMGDDTPESLFADFSEAAKASIERSAERVDSAQLARAAELIDSAGAIHIVGLRRAFAVASHVAYLLRKLDRVAVLHDAVGGIDSSALIREGDALLAISFAPYTPVTIALAEEARTKGAAVIALTDTRLSPLAALADVLFEISEEEVGGFRTFSATFCLATTICVAAGAAHE